MLAKPLIQKAVIAVIAVLSTSTLAKAVDALPTTLESQSIPDVNFHLTARPWSALNVASSAYTSRLLAECRYWQTRESGGQLTDPYGAGGNAVTDAEYAEAVATLLKAGSISSSDSLVASAVRVMNYLVGDVTNDGGRDFMIAPMTEALTLFKPFSGQGSLPAATYNSWASSMNKIYSQDNGNNNWTWYYMKGEWLQYKYPLSNVTHSAVTGTIEGQWTGIQKSLVSNRWNLYSDWVSGNLGPVSLSTEVAGRSNQLSVDYLGYDGASATVSGGIDPTAERGTFTSLLMQDPSGQNPCGGRTDDHCWVDAGIQACSEAMAEKLNARGGTTNLWQAGQFRHASMLTFNNLNRWLRSDTTYGGTFYVTKNQFNPSLGVGYQTASNYIGYNGNLMDGTAYAYNIRHTAITENPTPAEIGGYAFETDSNPSAANAWAGAFADAGGVFMQAALRGDTTQLNGNVWTSVGINRFGRPGWDTRLGPSDGASSKSANNGVSFAPAWLTSGTWNLMASHPGGYIGAFTTTLATPCLTRCQIVWSGSPSFTQNFTITPDGILVQTTSSAASGTWGVTCPLLKDTDGTSATFTTQSVSSHIASVTHAPAAAGFNQSDSQNFLLINTNGAAMTSGTAVQSTYGDLTPVEASTSDATNSIFVYPATASDPSASTVLSGFTTSGSGTTVGYNAPGLNSKVTGNLYVGRTSAGGNGNSIDLNGDGVADVTFNGVTCNFILQLSNGTVTKVETDTNVTGAVVQGHTLNLTAYTPQSVSGGTPPAPPTNLTATVSGTSVILNWTAGSGDNTYNVQRATTSGGPYSTIISGIGTTTYTDKPSPTGTYYYVVASVGTGGTSTNSNQATATTTSGGTIPAPPTGLVGTPGDSQVVLNWSPSTGATSYNVYRSRTGGPPWGAARSAGSATTFTDTTTVNGTAYTFAVTAVNASGESAVSNQVTVTPAAGATEVVDDPFTDGGRTNGSDPLDVAWYTMWGATSTGTIVNDNVTGGINAGNALELAPTAAFDGMVATWPTPVSLADGQSIVYSFTFRYTGTTNQNVTDNLRFGIYNSNGTSTTVDDDDNATTNLSASRQDDFGYYTLTNPGLSGTATEVGKETAADEILQNAGRTNLTTGGVSINAGTTVHAVVMTLTHSGSSLIISTSIDGLAPTTATDTSPVTTTFDEIAFCFGGTQPSPIIIDNIQVSSSP